MRQGRLVEVGPVCDVIRNPRHPYTAGLMTSIPVIGRHVKRLTQIDGTMPRLNEIPPGCAFNPRCPCLRPLPAGTAASGGFGKYAGRLLAYGEGGWPWLRRRL